VETQEYSSHVISGSKLHAAPRRRSDGLKHLSGAVCLYGNGDSSLSGRSGDGAHTGLNPRSNVMCRVRNSRGRSRDFTPPLRGLVQGTLSLPDDTGPIRKFDSHSREPRSWRTINYRMISLTIRTIMLRDFSFRHGVLTAPCVP